MSRFRVVSELFPGGAALANLAEPLVPALVGARGQAECEQTCMLQGRHKLGCKLDCGFRHAFGAKAAPTLAAAHGQDMDAVEKLCERECRGKTNPFQQSICMGTCRGRYALTPARGQADDAAARKVTAGMGINIVTLVVFVVALVVAAVYSFKLNTLLGDAETLQIVPPKLLKMCADIMVPTWLFIMTPFVNLGLAGGLGISVTQLQKQIAEKRAASVI